MPGWECPVCMLRCNPEEDACPACEALKPGTSKPKPAGVIKFGAEGIAPTFGSAKFGAPDLPPADSSTRSAQGPEGGGSHQTPTFGGPLLFGAGTIKFGASDAAPICQKPGTVTGTTSGRISFGPNGTIGQPKAEPSPTSTPLGGFCRATTTPKSEVPQPSLIGYDQDQLLSDHTGAPVLKSNCGIVYTWGSGECDQLAVRSDALDDNACRPTPILIKRLSEEEDQVESIVSGSMASGAILKDGQLYTWGCSDNGMLGRPLKGVESEVWRTASPPVDNQRYHCRVPAPVWNIPDRVVKATLGDCHGVALTDAGDCYAWGAYRDSFGQIGFYSFREDRIVEEQPVPEKQELGALAIDCASGDNHTVVLCSLPDGGDCLYFWGTSECGQLAEPQEGQEARKTFLKPFRKTLKELKLYQRTRSANSAAEDEEMMARGKIVGVFAGASTTFVKVASCDRTAVYGFGRNADGELGVGFVMPAVIQPAELHVPPLVTVTEIQGGDEASIALSSDGSIWVWGRRIWLGLGEDHSSEHKGPVTVPTIIHGLKNKVHSIGCKSKTFFAISRCGQIFAWGEGCNYQFGNGEAVALASRPTHVPNQPFEGLFVRTIAVGSQHCLALACEIERGLKRKREAPPPSLGADAEWSTVKRARVGDSSAEPQPVRIVDPVYPQPEPERKMPEPESQPSEVLQMAEVPESESVPTSNPSSELQTPVRVTAVHEEEEEERSPAIVPPALAEAEVEPMIDSDDESSVSAQSESGSDEDEEEEPPKAAAKSKGKSKAKAKAKAKPKSKAKAKAKAKAAARKEPTEVKKGTRRRRE